MRAADRRSTRRGRCRGSAPAHAGRVSADARAPYCETPAGRPAYATNGTAFRDRWQESNRRIPPSLDSSNAPTRIAPRCAVTASTGMGTTSSPVVYPQIRFSSSTTRSKSSMVVRSLNSVIVGAQLIARLSVHYGLGPQAQASLAFGVGHFRRPNAVRTFVRTLRPHLRPHPRPHLRPHLGTTEQPATPARLKRQRSAALPPCPVRTHARRPTFRPALRQPRAAEEPGLHAGRRRHACPGHRRQHGDLQRRR